MRSLREALCPGGLQVTATGQEEGVVQLPTPTPAGPVLRRPRTSCPGARLSGCKLLRNPAVLGLQAVTSSFIAHALVFVPGSDGHVSVKLDGQVQADGTQQESYLRKFVF